MANNIKKKKVSELPEATDTKGFWIFGYKAGQSVRFAFDKIASLFGVTQDKGQSITLAPSQKLFTESQDKQDKSIDNINSELIYQYDNSNTENITGTTTVGSYVNPQRNGVLTVGADYHYSGFLAVQSGQKIRISGCFGYNSSDSNFIAGVAGYSSNTQSTFVANIFDASMAGATGQGRFRIVNFITTIPEGVNYIRGCSAFQNSKGDELNLLLERVIGESEITLKEKVRELDEAVKNIGTSNLDISKDIEQGTLNFSGEPINDATRLRTNKFYQAKMLNINAINAGFEYRLAYYIDGVFVKFNDWGNTLVTWDLSAYTHVKIVFRKSANTTLSVSEFEKIGFKAVVNNETATLQDNIITRNKEAEKAVFAVRKRFFSFGNSNETEFPLFAHITDLHGDATRLANYIKYCEHIKVDAAFATGDLVNYAYTDDFDYYKEQVLKSNLLMLHLMGNHENVNASSQTDTDQYNRFFAPLLDKMNVSHESKCYYYKDLETKKIRIIALNEYQYGGSKRDHRYLLSDQVTWFINTLKSTPANFGVVILMHQPCHSWNADSNYSKFWQDKMLFTTLQTNINGSPISDIVDAFISRTSINKSYAQNGTVTSVNVNAHFSGVASGVEFIAYCNGHLHGDFIGYLDNTVNKQLVLNLICGVSLAGDWRSGLGDLPRQNGTVTEDAFNIYGINRDTKTVNVVRIGSNTNYKLEKRDFMSIPYR